jgi:hypothetical protein
VALKEELELPKLAERTRVHAGLVVAIALAALAWAAQCGHWRTGPSGVAAQSMDAIRAPISPPWRKRSSVRSGRTVLIFGRAHWLRRATPSGLEGVLDNDNPVSAVSAMSYA